jgi:hypothetical protein
MTMIRKYIKKNTGKLIVGAAERADTAGSFNVDVTLFLTLYSYP